ncbi:MAG: disulfide bond formation protein B [Trueperaceae bacterium]|nr:disulfide bond formation protein B [Trueperaceae bacterium]MCO5173873.1 disulfide oxidoreductase [Trueperaceae bacterium]MCW5819535.1 disulfide bond formation protein B [Trueperaceae bacterium]
MKQGSSSLIYPAWLVAIVATLGSLYFSEIRHFVPCTLCWYQRILMYPLVLVLGVASFTQDTKVVRYALPLSALGILVSGYHILVERIPGFGHGVCSSGVPCSLKYIDWLGFITIPTLAFVAFIMTTVMLTLVARRSAGR